MQKFIIGLAIFGLCGLVLSLSPSQFPFTSYPNCNDGNWQCALNKKCATCTIKADKTEVKKCETDALLSTSPCHAGPESEHPGFRCRCNGNPWNGLDELTGLITGVELGVPQDDECQTDTDCIDPTKANLHNRCATCHFDSFGNDNTRTGKFCDNPTVQGKQYCDGQVNKGKCQCSAVSSEGDTGSVLASIDPTAINLASSRIENGYTAPETIEVNNIAKPVADYYDGDNQVNQIDINKQPAINLLPGNLQAALPNVDLGFGQTESGFGSYDKVQTGIEQNGPLQNDFKVSSNPSLSSGDNDGMFAQVNPAFGRKKRAVYF